MSERAPWVYGEDGLETYDVFWHIIERSWPGAAALRGSLEGLEREELVAFYAMTRDAASAVRAPWEGLWVPEPGFEGGGFHLSEDATEDFTDWIVSQGRAYWAPLVGAADAALSVAYEDYCAVRASPDHARRWDVARGVVSLYGVAYTTYAERFNDELYEALEALYAG